MPEIVRFTKTGISAEMSHRTRGIVCLLIQKHLELVESRRHKIKKNAFSVFFPRLVSQVSKKDWHPADKGKVRMRMSEAEGLAVMWLLTPHDDMEVLALKDKLYQKLILTEKH